jgi:hypothetical protein
VAPIITVFHFHEFHLAGVEVDDAVNLLASAILYSTHVQGCGVFRVRVRVSVNLLPPSGAMIWSRRVFIEMEMLLGFEEG